MLQTRIFEEKLTSLYRGGMITGGVYVGRGQEAVSTACGLFLQKGDVFAPLIRDQAGRAAFGEPLLTSRALISARARDRCAAAMATSTVVVPRPGSWP